MIYTFHFIRLLNPNIETRNPKQIRNSNVQIFKTDSNAVILSEAKNLIIRRPDPFGKLRAGSSASPQDDTKFHFSYLDIVSNFELWASCFSLCFGF